jgi:hypothetical protein
LRDILQHGLILSGSKNDPINNTSNNKSSSSTSSIVPFGCFVVRSSGNNSNNNKKTVHAWDLLEKYFEIKHGSQYAQTASSKLSQSFNLNIIGGKPISIKQSLLNAIDHVYKLHKTTTAAATDDSKINNNNFNSNNLSTKESCFKAFVCLAIK